MTPLDRPRSAPSGRDPDPARRTPRGRESRRGSGQTALVGAGVLVAALVAVSSPAVAKGGFLNWEQWEPYTRPNKGRDVSYVWKADYDGITFPRQSTTVLTIKAPEVRPTGARRRSIPSSTTTGSRMPPSSRPLRIGDRDALIDDPLLPPAAREPANWMHQEVRVRALRDTAWSGRRCRLRTSAALPARTHPELATLAASAAIRSTRSGVTSCSRDRDSSPPRPPDYPEDIGSYGAFLGTPSGFAPPFGTRGRDALMREVLEGDQGDRRYELNDLARRSSESRGTRTRR